MAKPSKKKRMQFRQLETKYLHKYQPFDINTETGELTPKPKKEKKIKEVSVDPNIIGKVSVCIDNSTETPEQYCLECGKSRYSDFLFLGFPKSSYQWSSYRVCPTCLAKVKINYPDTMGGWWEETIIHLERFTEPIEINDKSILWQHCTLPPMYKYGNSELSINI